MKKYKIFGNIISALSNETNEDPVTEHSLATTHGSMKKTHDCSQDAAGSFSFLSFE